MCYHGTTRLVKIINKEQMRDEVPVDACIADEIQFLNNVGVITLGCCCGHGQTGKVKVWDAPVEHFLEEEREKHRFKWQTRVDPPITLIKEESVELAKSLGYRPYPYYYMDGESHGVWQMVLKTGCLTEDECKKWHASNERVDWLSPLRNKGI